MQMQINSPEMQLHAEGLQQAMALKSATYKNDTAPAMRKGNEDDWKWALAEAINTEEEMYRHPLTDERVLKIYFYYSVSRQSGVIINKRKVGIKVSGLSKYENELVGKYLLSGYSREFRPSFFNELFPTNKKLRNKDAIPEEGSDMEK